MQKLIKALIACTLIVEISLAAWLVLKCPDEIAVVIGEFESKEAALRASIKRLDGEIHGCSKAETYRVIWTVKDNPMRQATLYHRRETTGGHIGYEQDAFSGFAEDPFAANDVDVKRVAEKGGSLNDFSEYDERNR
jgi:hypothetical protein